MSGSTETTPIPIRSIIRIDEHGHLIPTRIPMTMPHLMNCSHSPDGWCLSCVKEMAEDRDRLQKAIETHHRQHADDRCWMDDIELYKTAGLTETIEVLEIGNPRTMLRNCKRFIRQRCIEGGPWVSYAELEADRDRLQAENKEIRLHNEKLAEDFAHSANECRDLCKVFDERDRLASELAELRAACEPFASKIHMDREYTSGEDSVPICADYSRSEMHPIGATIGDVRKLAALLARTPETL